jgi:uncharacterized membrane protein
MRQAHNGLEKGAALVECALTLPVLLLLLVVLLDLGLVVREHQVLQNAAREGARIAALPDNPAAGGDPSAMAQAVRQRVIAYLGSENIYVADSDITIDRLQRIMVGSSTVYASRVSIRHTRPLLITGGSLLPITEVKLQGSAVFRNLF